MRFRRIVLLLFIVSLLAGCANLESAAMKQVDRMFPNHDPGYPYTSGH